MDSTQVTDENKNSLTYIHFLVYSIIARIVNCIAIFKFLIYIYQKYKFNYNYVFGVIKINALIYFKNDRERFFSTTIK